MKRYFIYVDNISDKFWIIDVIENSTFLIFGKTGTAGVTKTKEFKDAAAAQKDAEKLIKEKLKKGYLEVTELIMPPNDGRFGENEFWEIIDKAKDKAEDLDEFIKQLTASLSQSTREDIIHFARIFYKYYGYSYQSRLWAAAYIINGGCSDDAFDYFRAWLIAQGKNAYFGALRDPDSLAQVIPVEDAGDIGCEDMLSVASTAYAIKTGESQEKIYDFILSVWLPDIEMDWDEDGDDLEKMFPQLWEKFGNN